MPANDARGVGDSAGISGIAPDRARHSTPSAVFGKRPVVARLVQDGRRRTRAISAWESPALGCMTPKARRPVSPGRSSWKPQKYFGLEQPGQGLSEPGAAGGIAGGVRAGVGHRSAVGPVRADRSISLLALGRFQEGWAEYEYRSPVRHIRTCQRRWRGEALAGRTLLVIAEQGLGDMMQFVRFLAMPPLRAASRVVLECQPTLKALFEHSHVADQVVDTTSPCRRTITGFR